MFVKPAGKVMNNYLLKTVEIRRKLPNVSAAALTQINQVS